MYRNIAPIPRVGFKGLCLQDGPLAIRQADYASMFPAGLSSAASWDRELIHERGKLLGEEFRGKGSQIFLGPVAGPLGRSGLAGRNWEGFSPDPYLTGVGMEETILGVQSVGVQATAKHWILNEQETQRNPEGAFSADHFPNTADVMSVSSNAEDRTLHELYVWPFANAVRAGVASVMCSYQRINGSYACQNSRTQNGILKTELGFQGYIMSDWMATHSGVASVQAGLDMDMPGALNWAPVVDGTPSFFGGNLSTAVENGTVPQTRIDDMVRRVLTPYYLLGQDQDFPGVDPSSGAYPNVNTFAPEEQWYDDWSAAGALNTESSVNVRANHSEHIRKLGAAGSVLLKNVNNALPLKSPKNIAVLGNAASELTNGLYPSGTDYEYGVLPVGGGSGSARFHKIVTPLQALKEKVEADDGKVQWILNNTALITPGVFAANIYPQPEVCLVFLKTWAAEGEDREDLHVNWNGDEVVTQVAANCSNTVVITTSGGLTLMPWADNENVTAILAAHFPGEQMGNSIVDLLYGDVNPSGKLPYTIAYEESDYYFANITASVDDETDTNAWQSDFTERLLIDYRYFDYHNISVQYEFGFGLSYTTFDLSDLSITPASNSSIAGTPATADITPGGNPALWDTVYTVSATVANTGNLTGAAVPQLYLALPESAGEGTPVRQLRGFDKVEIAAGETASVEFELMRRDLSVWDTAAQEWSVPEGEFGVAVGFSSRDLRVEGTFTV